MTITEGMTPAQFNTAMNDNITSIGYVGKVPTFDTIIIGHDIQTACLLAGLGTLNYGISGKSFDDSINAAFAAASTANKVIAGAVDVKTFGAVGDWTTDDTANIQTAVNAGNIIIQNGTFKIAASIKIPSNRTVYLFNCKVKKANASYDNFFTNSDFDGGNVGVNIIGLGGVELDGNIQYNDDDYATNPLNIPNGPPPRPETSYKNLAMFFCNVNGLSVSGLSISNLPFLGTLYQNCQNAKFHHVYQTLDLLNRNQDCFDVLGGIGESYNIEAYNLSMTAGDDFCAMGGTNESNLGYINGVTNWNLGDVHDIYIHDITVDLGPRGCVFVPIVGDGAKVYNIRYENILVRRCSAVMYAAYPEYNVVPCAKTDLHDITIKNIKVEDLNFYTGLTYNCLNYFGKNMMDFSIENLIYVKDSSNKYVLIAGDQSDNVKINGVQVT